MRAPREHIFQVSESPLSGEAQWQLANHHTSGATTTRPLTRLKSSDLEISSLTRRNEANFQIGARLFEKERYEEAVQLYDILSVKGVPTAAALLLHIAYLNANSRGSSSPSIF